MAAVILDILRTRLQPLCCNLCDTQALLLVLSIHRSQSKRGGNLIYCADDPTVAESQQAAQVEQVKSEAAWWVVAEACAALQSNEWWRS